MTEVKVTKQMLDEIRCAVKERDSHQCVWCSCIIKTSQEAEATRLFSKKAYPKLILELDNYVLACSECSKQHNPTNIGYTIWMRTNVAKSAFRFSVVKARIEALQSVSNGKTRAAIDREIKVMNGIRSYSNSSSAKLRVNRTKFLLKRDGDQCVWCRKALDINSLDMTFEHLIPESQGGTSALFNIALCCMNCNNSRSDKALQEWVEISRNARIEVVKNCLVEYSKSTKQSKVLALAELPWIEKIAA